MVNGVVYIEPDWPLTAAYEKADGLQWQRSAWAEVLTPGRVATTGYRPL